LFIADGGNNRVRKVDAQGVISTAVGMGIMGHSGWRSRVPAISLSDVITDLRGNLYVCEAQGLVLKINARRFVGMLT
jgi:hypothetical protein